MMCVVCVYLDSKLKDEQNSQKISPQIYKTRNKILAISGLA